MPSEETLLDCLFDRFPPSLDRLPPFGPQYRLETQSPLIESDSHKYIVYCTRHFALDKIELLTPESTDSVLLSQYLYMHWKRNRSVSILGINLSFSSTPTLEDVGKQGEVFASDQAHFSNEGGETLDCEGPSRESDQDDLIFHGTEVEIIAEEAISIQDTPLQACSLSLAILPLPELRIPLGILSNLLPLVLSTSSRLGQAGRK
ncbi:hypothetical protein ACMFMF_011872 [Clarireedia jacksonii]